MELEEKKEILKLVDWNDEKKHNRKIEYAKYLFQLKGEHQNLIHKNQLEQITLRKK